MSEIQERKETIMSDWVNDTTETRKNKYELVGGNAAPVNPYGAAQEYYAAKGIRTETESDPFLQIEKEVGFLPQETPKPVQHHPAEDSAAPEAPKGFRLNPILVVAVISLLALGTGWMLGVFRKKANPIDGSYKFDHAVANGKVVTPSQLYAYGVNTNGMAIRIDGDYADLTVFGFTGHCDFEQDGNDIKVTNGSKYMTGKASITEETVTLQHNGTDLVFEKE